MNRPRTVIVRYTTSQRVNHWINAICFTLMVLSGLSMFHPIMFWLSNLFGGGQWTRAIHPWIGCVLMASYIGMIAQFWRANLWRQEDTAWMKSVPAVIEDDEEHIPAVGHNNAGQKLVFWSMTLLIPTLFITGLTIWEVYFGEATSIPVQRAAVLIHSTAAFLAIIIWIVHVYAGIWVRHSVRAMTQGYVTPGWAWRHHRKWLWELASGQNGKNSIRKRP
jgi:formate dehydrogenase subunit gamma